MFSMTRSQKIKHIEDEALVNNKLQVLPHEFWCQFSQEQVQFFCLRHAFYNIPTLEQVAFLEAKIPDKSKALEIGAGNGVLAQALGIRATDNYMQEMQDVKEYYKAMRQPTVQYGENVENIDAEAAIEKYKPTVVIGAWITQKYNPTYPSYGGNALGPDQRYIIDNVDKYFLVGNFKIHDHPSLRNYTPKLHKAPLISRASHPEANVIFEYH